MKLQELLRKGSFDRMFGYIVKFDPKQEGSRFCYQAAYALLCDMEAETGREYDVVPNPYAKEKEGVAREITVWCPELEGCNWQKALGAEMVPLDMIAGICLWHITFYGFNPDEEEETFNNMVEEEFSEDDSVYMVKLAFCYEYGLGTDVDLDMARAMFKQAGQSENGHGKPEEHLAMLEVNEENYSEALHWFKEAQRKVIVQPNRIFGI
jgi:TPR repeat protein